MCGHGAGWALECPYPHPYLFKFLGNYPCPRPYPTMRVFTRPSWIFFAGAHWAWVQLPSLRWARLYKHSSTPLHALSHTSLSSSHTMLSIGAVSCFAGFFPTVDEHLIVIRTDVEIGHPSSIPAQINSICYEARIRNWHWHWQSDTANNLWKLHNLV